MSEIKKEKDVKQRQVNLIISVLKSIVLGVIALGFQFWQMGISGMPSHISVSFSLVPELLGAFAFGPIVGTGIVGVKLMIYYFITDAIKISIIDNFIINGGFVFVVGLAYTLEQRRFDNTHDRTRNEKEIFKHRIIALFVGVLASILIVYVCRVYITYPFMIEKMGLSKDYLLQQYNIRTVQTDLRMCVWRFDCMAQVLKCTALGAVTLLIYRLASPFFKQINI